MSRDEPLEPPPDEKTSPAPPKKDDAAVPAFARSFPSDPAVQALVIAFREGRYDEVRRGSRALDGEDQPEDVRKAARELRRRLSPDPLSICLLIFAALLLVFLAGFYYLNSHEH